MPNELTMEQFQKVLPKKVRKTLNVKLLDGINKVLSDPLIRDSYRENLLSYTNVLNTGPYKIESYINAVRYVSFKLLGSTNLDAYVRTFPDRYQKFMQSSTSSEYIAQYVSAYNKNKLVNMVFEQTLIPVHILNADIHQKAINVQADLMLNANSEKVRTDAANSLLNHLKMPETQRIELDIGFKEDKTIQELRNTTMALVAQQRQMLEAGAMTIKEIAHSKLLIEDGEIVDE